MNKDIDKQDVLADWLIKEHNLNSDEAENLNIEEMCQDDTYGTEYGEYLVLTDEEAEERAKEYILDSVWAFHPEWLASHSSSADAEVFQLLQEKCEDANDAILKLIDDVDHFVNDSILADGRGHFISNYDGEEHEHKYKDTWYYIYQVN